MHSGVHEQSRLFINSKSVMGPELCVLAQGKRCAALFWVAEWRYSE